MRNQVFDDKPVNMKFGQSFRSEMTLQKSFNNTQSSFASGNSSSSLKGKLVALEDTVQNLTEELECHKKQVRALQTEKDTLESVLNMKIQDVRNNLTNEVARVEGEMKRYFDSQRAENARMQQQITTLKDEKTALQQKLLDLQQRIAELEGQVGFD